MKISSVNDWQTWVQRFRTSTYIPNKAGLYLRFYIPDNAITGACAHNISGDWHHTVDWQRVAWKSVTDISPLSPIKDVDDPLWGTTQDLLVPLKVMNKSIMATK